MNLIFRLKLRASIVAFMYAIYGVESVDAEGRFKASRYSNSWVEFTKLLQKLKLEKDFNIAISLLWIAINAPTLDRRGYRFKSVAYHCYCKLFNQISSGDDGRSYKSGMYRILELRQAIEKLGLPTDYEPTYEELGYERNPDI